MIDRAGRDRLALALRRYVVGRITSDDLECVETDWRDRGARAVHQISWNLYSDNWGHYAVGSHAIHPEVRREICRWIVFLHSDQEYLWPEYSFIRICLPWFGKRRPNLKLGALEVRWSKKLEQFLEVGDREVWPFIDRASFDSVRLAPRFFARSRQPNLPLDGQMRNPNS